MLKDWLSEEQAEALEASRRTRRAYAGAAIAAEAIPCFGWDTLARVLAAEPAPDALVVRRSELLPQPPPTRVEEVRSLFELGAGVVVRRAERHDGGLAALAARFEREQGGRAHVQLFVTPGGMHGFGWHYDAEDVYILQTEGVKSYYFRENTQSPCLDPEATPDFTRVLGETSPVQTCTLVAGDALYLPAGMWHVARARAHSLSISLGLCER